MSFRVPPARCNVFSRFLKACRTCASKLPASAAPASSTNPTWPASQIVLPPSVTTAGENEYFASQDGSMILFSSGIFALHAEYAFREIRERTLELDPDFVPLNPGHGGYESGSMV